VDKTEHTHTKLKMLVLLATAVYADSELERGDQTSLATGGHKTVNENNS